MALDRDDRTITLFGILSSLDDVSSTIGRYASWLSEYLDYVAVVYKDEGHFIVHRPGTNKKPLPKRIDTAIEAFRRGDWFSPWVLESRGKFELEPRILSVCQGDGTLLVCTQGGGFSDDVDMILEDSSLLLSYAIERAIEYEHLVRQALSDSLTSLPNRYEFDLQIRASLDRARRYGSGFSVVLFDLDGFKSLNDSFGHHAGDTALKSVATALNSARRESDFICRIGGDEFAAILPNTNGLEAWSFAERVQKNIERAGIPTGQALLTTSFGIASWREEMTVEELLEESDRNLYTYKREVR